MRRRIFSLAALLSLLLCAATVVLWAFSYQTRINFGYTTFNPEGANWRWRNGLMWVNLGYCSAHLSSHLSPSRQYEEGWGYRPGEWYWQSGPAGFRQTVGMTPLKTLWFASTINTHYTDPDVIGGTEIDFRFPLWFPVLLTAILPFLWMRRLRRHFARRGYVCKECGYSLTGNTSGVCPECGTAVAGKAAT